MDLKFAIRTLSLAMFAGLKTKMSIFTIMCLIYMSKYLLAKKRTFWINFAFDITLMTIAGVLPLMPSSLQTLFINTSNFAFHITLMIG